MGVPEGPTVGEKRLSGNTIISELIRNMELGQFELAYTVLLPCAFSVYLNPEDHARLTGVFDLIAEDANRALRARVAALNTKPTFRWHSSTKTREYKIACPDWFIEFFADAEVPAGDVEIHSQLNEVIQPSYRGVRTTLTDRESSVTPQDALGATRIRSSASRVYGEVRYEDDSGPQLYLITQNEVRVGRGGDAQPMDLALYASDEVSREHLLLRRDPANGIFLIVDRSANGTWLNGKRLKTDVAEVVPDRAEINLAEVILLNFEAKR
jgi:pSer/pThr/pTyr-binding forkhead associated (FHA) protein